jgi:hypothetical protein
MEIALGPEGAIPFWRGTKMGVSEIRRVVLRPLHRCALLAPIPFRALCALQASPHCEWPQLRGRAHKSPF